MDKKHYHLGSKSISDEPVVGSLVNELRRFTIFMYRETYDELTSNLRKLAYPICTWFMESTQINGARIRNDDFQRLDITL